MHKVAPNLLALHGGMTFRRLKLSPGFRVTVSALWLPYLLIHCPTCPEAVTSFSRCLPQASAAEAEGGHHSDHSGHGHDGRQERTPQDGGEHDHAPGSDCCQYSWQVAAATSQVSAVEPASPAPVFGAAVPIVEVTAGRGRIFHRVLSAPQAHSPPLFLLLQTYLC